MPVLDSADVLPKYEVDPEQIFDALNNPDCGLAYVAMPKGVNPQGMVEHYADLRRHNRTNENTYYYEYEYSPDYYPTISDEQTSRAMAQEFRIVYEAIRGYIDNLLLPRIKGIDNLNRIAGGQIQVQTFNNHRGLQKIHTDHEALTTYLGSSQPGHMEKFPNEGWVHVNKLEPGYVLLSRQRRWGREGTNLRQLKGISHYADWHSEDISSERVTGIDFISWVPR